MAAAVAREKDHVTLAELAAEERVGRAAERRRELDLLDRGETLHLIEAAPADHSKHGPAHLRSPLVPSAGLPFRVQLSARGRDILSPALADCSGQVTLPKDRLKALDRGARQRAQTARLETD